MANRVAADRSVRGRFQLSYSGTVSQFLVQVTVMDITSPGISVTGENLLQRSDIFGRGGFVGQAGEKVV